MDLKNEKRLFELLYRLVVRGKCAKEKTPYYPQKTECCTNVSDAPSLELYSPESVGVSSEYITSLLKELEKSSEYLHTVVILCKGKKIAEAAAPGYSTHRRHVTHSLAKSVTLLAVGMLVDEGRLKLSDLACELLGVKASSKTHSITVEDLLTMRTNVVFSEVLGAVTEDNWIKAFFSSSVKNEPGTGFAYNSMNSYILSAIVQKLTGQNLSEYLRPRLWEPLGITNIFWENARTELIKADGDFISQQRIWQKSVSLSFRRVYGTISALSAKAGYRLLPHLTFCFRKIKRILTTDTSFGFPQTATEYYSTVCSDKMSGFVRKPNG